MNIQKQVQAVIDGILAGKLLETFDTYYADNVVMSENRKEERAGKAANREYEEKFLGNVQEFHGAQSGGHWWMVTMPQLNGRLTSRLKAEIV